MLGTVLLIILILMLVGAFPTWPYAANWGYGWSPPALLLVIIVLFLLFGYGRF